MVGALLLVLIALVLERLVLRLDLEGGKGACMGCVEASAGCVAAWAGAASMLASHWFSLQQAVVSASLIHHERAGTSEIVHSTNIGIYGSCTLF